MPFFLLRKLSPPNETFQEVYELEKIDPGYDFQTNLMPAYLKYSIITLLIHSIYKNQI